MTKHSRLKADRPLPTDIVLAPSWWYKNAGITFDEDFFYNPFRRVEMESLMEGVLYDHWGQYGLGNHRLENRPEVGAVHLAAGFMISEMLGCRVEYREADPPQVIPAERQTLEVDSEAAFRSPVFRRFEELMERLQARFGFLTGDVNWGGILNVALDLRGQQIFTDMLENPAGVQTFFREIARVIYRFVGGIAEKTGTTSISVNRNVIHLDPPVFLHSECSHTMISVEHYRDFLFSFDAEWNQRQRPFGIHYCGSDPHRHAPLFTKLPDLDFLDVGWGGDILSLRRHLPGTFFNIRLSPVEIITWSREELQKAIRTRVRASGDPRLTGVCCINMDDQVPDDKITTIFETVKELREELAPES